MERTAEMKIIILLHTFPITRLLIADFVSRTLKRIRIRKQNVTVTTEINSQIQKPIRSSLVSLNKFLTCKYLFGLFRIGEVRIC